MPKKITEKIKLWGIVQGVGFRPYVAKVAMRFHIKGEVRNIGGLVEIVLTDTEKHISEFINQLKVSKPEPSEIVHIKREIIPYRDFADFKILKSSEDRSAVAMIPADQGVCPSCLKEMMTPGNPRYMHPFISCMVCGPRYSIVDRLPYDRENTSMNVFSMCRFCQNEYDNIENRRYHAQTISCHNCGPQMDFKLMEESLLTEKPPLEKSAALLREGRVIAFKSMGGYNLMANPFDLDAVETLRNIKDRDKKPFAVMFSSVKEIEKYCEINSVESQLIQSSARPIILLKRKTMDQLQEYRPRNYSEWAKNRFVGAFLPSMGAQYILLELFGGPLISTSANHSGMPMVGSEEDMFKMMQAQPLIAETFYNLRDIRVSVDDSVVRVIDGQPQMLRRAKGYVPVPLHMNVGEEMEIFAAGGQLKNSFCLSKDRFAYMSQYFGDMDKEGNQKIYRRTFNHMKKLFNIKPNKVVCDMHPGYFTTAFAKQYAEDMDLPLLKVQHHHAHVASVIAEHDLDGLVLGISFDGAGYGEDGAIWGGEFLLCRGDGFKRLNHLAYTNIIGGDISMKEAWKSAICFMKSEKLRKQRADDEGGPGISVDIREYMDYADRYDTLYHRNEEIAIVEKALDMGINVFRSSSMGRLFDAVTAMLGICDYNSYEGMCGVKLEDAAARGMERPGMDEADDLALIFHKQIAQMILSQVKEAASLYRVEQVALSGGVFQNQILMEETLRLLRKAGYSPYYNISVSPNDGGIALGQCYIAAGGRY